MQTIVMTSDKGSRTLPGFFHQWAKYFRPAYPDTGIVCGFTPPKTQIPAPFIFCSIGNQNKYPAHLWSDALLKVLDTVADEVFLLMLDDYWLVRPTDTKAIKMMVDYMYQFQNVIKFDVTMERLFADGGGKYNFGYNTYNTLGYLDLIKSNHQSPYHLSLWGGVVAA